MPWPRPGPWQPSTPREGGLGALAPANAPSMGSGQGGGQAQRLALQCLGKQELCRVMGGKNRLQWEWGCGCCRRSQPFRLNSARREELLIRVLWVIGRGVRVDFDELPRETGLRTVWASPSWSPARRGAGAAASAPCLVSVTAPGDGLPVGNPSAGAGHGAAGVGVRSANQSHRAKKASLGSSGPVEAPPTVAHAKQPRVSRGRGPRRGCLTHYGGPPASRLDGQEGAI